MRFFKYVLLALSLIFVLATVIPLIPTKWWWVKILVFPRVQISAFLAVLLTLWLIFFFRRHWSSYLLILLMLGALGYQFYRIHPYTPFAKKQTSPSGPSTKNANISAITANVYMKNHEVQPILNQIYRLEPDLVLLLETDRWWQRQMDTLKATYAYSLSRPLDNTYGMLLYSRLPLQNAEIRYLMEDSIPSMHAQVRLRNGSAVKIYCLHPRPPVPPESKTSTDRDAELLLVGKMVKQSEEPAIVMGDLNDVAWSYTTRLFLKTSQMFDPRIGRGFYNTFNANNPLMRCSLDHVFHTEAFQLNKLKVLPDINSDHFPIYFSFSYEPGHQEQQEPLEPVDPQKKDTINETIEKGLKKEDSQ